MQPIYSAVVTTNFGDKSIEVFNCDILNFSEPIDILAVSAFPRNYRPTAGTVLGALNAVGISVQELAGMPLIDLRYLCNVWLSQQIYSCGMIQRIGCIEFSHTRIGHSHYQVSEQALLNSIKAFFQMLDIAADYDVSMHTIALPLLGTGNQKISESLLLIPILNECISFLRRNTNIRRICFIERNPYKANLISMALKNSYVLHQDHNTVPSPRASGTLAFISYSSNDRTVAHMLCEKLERNGIPVWYAPRDVRGPYASAIVDAIEKATHFIVILSQNSVISEHVLNEVDLAFQKLPGKIKFKPIRIYESPLSPSMNYYLSRQHWMDANIPPLEQRLDEFVESIIQDI